MILFTFPISHIISPAYVYSFAGNNKSIVNNLHSRMNMEQDDDTQWEESIPEGKNGTLIPDDH